MSIDIRLPPPEPGPAQPMVQEYSDPSPVAPVQPVQLGPDDKFQFNCHKGIACFNKCCQNIDIMLAPYDVLRLKKRLGISSRDFLDSFTRDFAMDGHGHAGAEARDQGRIAGLRVPHPKAAAYARTGPRPAATMRSVLLSMRKKGSPTDEDSYFVVKRTTAWVTRSRRRRPCATTAENRGWRTTTRSIANGARSY